MKISKRLKNLKDKSFELAPEVAGNILSIKQNLKLFILTQSALDVENIIIQYNKAYKDTKSGLKQLQYLKKQIKKHPKKFTSYSIEILKNY